MAEKHVARPGSRQQIIKGVQASKADVASAQTIARRLRDAGFLEDRRPASKRRGFRVGDKIIVKDFSLAGASEKVILDTRVVRTDKGMLLVDPTRQPRGSHKRVEFKKAGRTGSPGKGMKVRDLVQQEPNRVFVIRNGRIAVAPADKP